MPVTLAFDVYGTLIDTHGVVEALGPLVGDRAREFSRTWRDKQLEYSFRRGLMQHYEDFAACTRQALDYTCAHYRTSLSAPQKLALLERYRTLPPFADAAPGLERLRDQGYRLFAFSNGTSETVRGLLAAAALADYFIDIVSVDDLRSYKPNPAVYCHFLRRSGASGGEAWLISSNPFDVIGALAAGMRAAWIRRSEDAIFDPWGMQPTLSVKSLTDLSDGLSNR